MARVGSGEVQRAGLGTSACRLLDHVDQLMFPDGAGLLDSKKHSGNACACPARQVHSQASSAPEQKALVMEVMKLTEPWKPGTCRWTWMCCIAFDAACHSWLGWSQTLHC